jgi:hypothetical protein
VFEAKALELVAPSVRFFAAQATGLLALVAEYVALIAYSEETARG